jgi:hypothetical protein
LKINYLIHNQIDKQKWDLTITDSPNGLVYALSWYLDIVSPSWDALILGDYEIVMPLPAKSILGQRLLIQPIFAHQLGIFSKNTITPDLTIKFIEETIKHFKFIDIKLNKDNPTIEKRPFYKRKTQILDLSKSYNEISEQFNRSLKSNLTKSKRTDFVFTICNDPDVLINAMRSMYERKNVDGVKKSDYQNLKRIIEYSIRSGIGKIYCALAYEQVYSAIFVLYWKNRAYTFYGTTLLGREKRSMVALMDYYIKENAGKNLILDFCGSNIPGVAEWNIGFGAQDYNYSGVQMNRLPFWLKAFNK